MADPTLVLTPEVLAELDRVLSSLDQQSSLGRVPALCRALEPYVAEDTRVAIARALETQGGTSTMWSALYADPSEGPLSSEEAVPGESTLDEEGGDAFERDTIRRLVRMRDGVLDLRRWLRAVPQVHGSFALSGAQKTVTHLQTTTIAPGDALLDAFADEMAAGA